MSHQLDALPVIYYINIGMFLCFYVLFEYVFKKIYNKKNRSSIIPDVRLNKFLFYQNYNNWATYLILISNPDYWLTVISEERRKLPLFCSKETKKLILRESVMYRVIAYVRAIREGVTYYDWENKLFDNDNNKNINYCYITTKLLDELKRIK
jgi:hypothetical protein